MEASQQVQYESRVRMRFAVLAFIAALLIVGTQLLQLTGPHASVQELTLDLITAHQRETEDIVGAAVDMFALFSIGVLLGWLHMITAARRPDLMKIVRWLAVGGAFLSAIMAILYTVVIASKVQTFVSTGNQGYPEADKLTTGGLLIVLPLLLQLGTLMLTIGCIWTSLNAMRVGLIVRPLGYIGIIAGALFLFPLGALVPLIQGVWLAGLAVVIAGRWPAGDPPAWAAGIAVPWLVSAKQEQELLDRRAMRGTRGQRRRVSDAEVLSAVDSNDDAADSSPTSVAPSTGTTKRKRKRKS